MSPTNRSLKLMRDAGWLVGSVEKYNSFIKQRFDLFGFADLIAVKNDTVLLIQTTTGSNSAARVSKIYGNSNARIWLGSANRHICVHSWAKRGERGKMKRWSCVSTLITLAEFPSLADADFVSSK